MSQLRVARRKSRNALDDRGAEMVIAGDNDQLRRLFEISGLTSAFTFAP